MELLRLAALAPLRRLSVQQLGDLAPCASERTLKSGRRLLLAGPFAQELVLVAAGRARVRCAGEAAGELGPGDVFGALAAPRSAYPTASVTALGDLRLVTFSACGLRRLRESAPESISALLSACALAPPERSEQAAVPRLAVVHAAAA